MAKFGLPEVEHIELSEKNVRWRLIASIAFALIAVVMIGYFVSSLLTTEPGWQIVKSNAKESCAGELILEYNFDSNATLINRRLTKLYSELTESAYKLFSSERSFENVHNLRFISLNPNVWIELDPALYDALEKFGARRELFLAPIYDEYSTLFFCSYDYEAVNFDPSRNAEQREYFDRVLSFALDPEKISLEFGSDSRVMLHVSEEYLAFAEEYGIVNLIDFGWTRNAFIVDYIADRLCAEGFTDGILHSYEGYMRAFCGCEFTYPVYDRRGMTVYNAAVARFDAPMSALMSVVSFRDFFTSRLDSQHYYEYDDGTILTPYIGSDGLCRSPVSSLVLFSDKKGCADLLLEGIPAYVVDDFDESMLESGRIWCQDKVIYYSGEVTLDSIYSDDITYTVKNSGEAD